MKKTKLILSAKEKELVTDARWILTKNRILEKIKVMFGFLQQQYASLPATALLPEEILMVSAKISRGENYLGLPWMVLDYPRYFTAEHIFAVRTLFWWGRYFSITLQLHGKHRDGFLPHILAGFSVLKQTGFFLCTGRDPWNHNYLDGNYKSLRRMNEREFKTRIRTSEFIKLTAGISLKKRDSYYAFLEQRYRILISAVTGQLPRR
ncbi:MAG: hypothetical protein N2747_04410 [Chitinophagaceae bacterium]|nr:hypothetical protein [Chitinophagaceae bacterium]